jgi:ABC-type phosphate transport system substrate-binding protein
MKTLIKTFIAASLAFAAVAAHADVAVIVSAKSTATTMTAEDVASIYLGKSTTMKPVDNAAPVRAQFYARVAGRDEAQMKAIWSKLVFTGKAMPPKELASNEEVVKAVAANPNAIGYVDKAAVDSSVKVVYEVK